MGRCRRSPAKHRHSRKRGSPNDYKNGMRGHSWQGKGNKRKCSRCGQRPKNSVFNTLGWE